MRTLNQIGVARVPSIHVTSYLINQACPKCLSTALNIQFVGKGQEVLLMDHHLQMLDEGFTTRCTSCGFEFVQYIVPPNGIIPQLLDSVLVGDLRLIISRIEEAGEFVGTTLTITPDMQLSIERLKKYVETHS